MGFDMINAWRISNINEKYKWVVWVPVDCVSQPLPLQKPISHVAEHLNLDFFFQMTFIY